MLSYILTGSKRDTLDELRERLAAKGTQVSRMAKIEGAALDYKAWTLDKVEFWLALQGQAYCPKDVMGFAAWVGHGCEPMVFGLCGTEDGLKYEGFCETYGDQTPSMEVFEHRHIQACSMLDEAMCIGLGVDVVDHSGYWVSKDLAQLRKAACDTRELAGLVERAAISNPLIRLAKALYTSQTVVRPT